jgi:hypothetical protein
VKAEVKVEVKEEVKIETTNKIEKVIENNEIKSKNSVLKNSKKI